MTSVQELTSAAETEWLGRWTTGPTEGELADLPSGSAAPDLLLPDHAGRERRLSEYWSGQPVLLMFWRHFGCWCGFQRAERLRNEVESYRAVGLNPVIVAQGEPERAAAYRAEHSLPCDVLCDPDYRAYRAYGVGHWQLERILPDAAPELWAPSARHRRELSGGAARTREAAGRRPVARRQGVRDRRERNRATDVRVSALRGLPQHAGPADCRTAELTVALRAAGCLTRVAPDTRRRAAIAFERAAERLLRVVADSSCDRGEA